MTIIVAVKKGNKAAIAADFQTTQGDTVVSGHMRKFPRKIHHIADAYIGIAGTTAHHLVLRSLAASQPDLFNFDNGDAILETFRRIHPMLKKDYFLETKENDNDQEYQSNQMVGLIISKGGIFSFFSYREITEYETFWASGSGKRYALGACEAAYNNMDDPKAIAEIGVQAACKFDRSCGLPLESYEVELEK